MLAVLAEGLVIALVVSLFVSAVIAALVACVLLALAPPETGRPDARRSIGAAVSALASALHPRRPRWP